MAGLAARGRPRRRGLTGEPPLFHLLSKDLPLTRKASVAGKVLADEGLSEMFGIELAAPAAPAKPKRAASAVRRGPGGSKAPTARTASRGARRR